MYISILSQFRCFSEKIIGRLNRNLKKSLEKPRQSYGAGLELYGVLPFLLSIKVCRILITV